MMAGAIGSNGRLMVLKMGEQVKIVDLAKDMITLAGLMPNEDIEVEYIGLRPGEKLYEELFVEDEGILPSAHPKIMIAETAASPNGALLSEIEELRELAIQVRRDEIVEKIKQLVPSYTPARQPLNS
jgi:FlaA1/EpsC-like NDP-sugar epimerase